jgi:hypothetical protein
MRDDNAVDSPASDLIDLALGVSDITINPSLPKRRCILPISC